MAKQQRPFALPDSTSLTTVALVPKGLTVTAIDDIRPRPRARAIALPKGTYKVAFVTLGTEPTIEGGIETARYHVLSVDGWPTEVDGNHKFMANEYGEALYYADLHPSDGKPWGWYGLDWLYDENSEEADEDGYVRLRRMVKPVQQAAFFTN